MGATGNIYVCEFITGDYVDREVSPMVAFYLEEDAESFVKKCNKFLKKNNLHYDNMRSDNPGTVKFFDLEDKKFRIDNTGAEVKYYPVELRGL